VPVEMAYDLDPLQTFVSYGSIHRCVAEGLMHKTIVDEWVDAAFGKVQILPVI
jgi:hypothetical protein